MYYLALLPIYLSILTVIRRRFVDCVLTSHETKVTDADVYRRLGPWLDTSHFPKLLLIIQMQDSHSKRLRSCHHSSLTKENQFDA